MGTYRWTTSGEITAQNFNPAIIFPVNIFIDPTSVIHNPGFSSNHYECLSARIFGFRGIILRKSSIKKSDTVSTIRFSQSQEVFQLFDTIPSTERVRLPYSLGI